MATTTLLASAARTAAPASSVMPSCQQTTTSWLLTLGVTVASGTGGLKVQVLWTDPVSGISITLFQASAFVTTVSTNTYEIKPGASLADANTIVASSLPNVGNLTVNVLVGDSSSYTYSLTLTQS